ncbi:MAG: Serine/threonine-protein kinase Pkn1 [Chlamydiae bacterium]|nr:Serine/threonine-protein kinase Pkn1 [Chlamydiota bacterium]
MTRRHLGDYTILKQIGQGSLGNVYLAEHRFMKRQYAIKELPEELAQDKNFISRFEEEVGRIAALNHDHIISIHNISYADGCYFLVMDCIVDELGETTNFAQYMAGQKNPLAEEDLIDWMMQIAQALDYAHSRPGGQAMIHRGLKLNNLLVGRNDLGKQGLYIADFGLSRIIGMGTVLSRIYQSLMRSLEIGKTSETSSNTELEVDKLQRVHNSFLQSYAFLAPEQKNLGDSLDAQNKVDTYAFGILVYYAITKKFPEGIFDMPCYLVPHYRKNWDLLISKCLQADPAKRPESLVDAMNQLLEDKKAPQTLVQSMTQINEKNLELDPKVEKEEEAKEKVEAVAAVTKPKFKDVTLLKPAEATALLAPKVTVPKPVLQQGEIKRPTYDPDPGAIFKMETKVTHYQPKVDTEVKIIEPIHTEMTVIKEGSFLRGSKDGNRDEMPQHKVHLKSFAIDIHPITNEQFARFLDAMGGEKDSQNNDIIRLKESRIKRSGGKLSIESGYAKHPVVGVSWYGAIAYVKWVGKRLPTEAEWEAACKGGEDLHIYPTGNEIEKHQANFFSSDTTSVMSYPANGYGLYDMVGNVYEWCQDWYGYNYYEASMQEPHQPKGPHQGVYRVLRGGCWKSLREDLRCSHRHRNNPGCENRTYGFRCATDAE